jgi:endonuclease/exonuclease/phosphatase (EEP) superfamily protein YafD
MVVVLQSILLVLGAGLIFVTLLSELRVDVWWVRIWDFPRYHVAVVGLLVLLALLWTEPWEGWTIGVLVGLFGAVGYQAWRVFPHFPVARTEVMDAQETEGAANISVLTANVLQPNRRGEAFLDLVREFDPDIFLAVETDEWWASVLEDLESDYPHGVRYPLNTTYGMVLYSKLELVEPEVRFLVDEEIPSIRTGITLSNGAQVSLYAVHPDPPNPRYATETTERDAELLIVGREAKEHDGPTIVVGDFNDVAWSHTTRLFRRVSGLIDPRIGRGFYNTFHAEWPLFRWPMDHIYHSTDFRLARIERGPYFGSDHFPVYAELELDPEAQWEQPEPTAEPKEEKETTEKIVDGRK